ncbi:MAG: DUF2236 domain-containing protein [Austwickia sp.]|nr:DUF2236 domain-containing protein [Austwickia sp.]MBK8436962.1 DUF2236 domain-containing protein [Austwickia sp.]MBK9100589.1 DUF2236 domain-containing protein [Austwickia sp.]
MAPARTRLATALRGRVAGEDAPERAAVIWGTPGPRWFTPQDEIWRVHADAAMFAGGIRALLLQSLHPLAMAGVAGHSGYRSDPWGRLQRTSYYLASTTFGTIEHAEAVIDRVRSIHQRVRGRAPDGRPYAASDPHLLAWVHLAEVDSFLATYQAYGPRPLSDTDSDRYVAQSAVVVSQLGVLDPPRSIAELREQLSAYRPELIGTEAAREAARFLLREPPLPVAQRPGYALLAAGAVALLPAWARAELGLPPMPLPARLAATAAGRLGTGVVRWAMADPALAAERRSVSPS